MVSPKKLLHQKWWSLDQRYISAIFVYNVTKIHTLNIDRSNKRKYLYTKKKARSRWYPSETKADADYTYDLALLANIPAQAESQLHSLEQAIGSIDLYVNANKTESMCFEQNGAISTFNGKPLKLIDKFP